MRMYFARGRSLLRTATLLALNAVLFGPAQADIYRCTDADGGVVFAQTPCEEAAPVQVAEPAQDSPLPDCNYANKFAAETARLMRAGVRSDELFNRYGGIDSLSRSSIGIINYVYSFRTNDNVTVERIVGLAQAKCQAQAFGDVSCPRLPPAFTDNMGGCEAGAEPPPVAVPVEPAAAAPPPTGATPEAEYARQQAARALREQAIEDCKKAYREEIDAIDADMRRGYSSEEGERYRERLRSLTERLRQCE
jgi:Domain of unknown function (DUF4124)